MPFRLGLATALICLGLLMTGCSQRLGYNLMDWWMSWQVRQHVSLDRSQRRLVRDHIRDFHAWHRETQLPRYADFLEQELERLETQTVTVELLETQIEAATDLWEDSARYLAPAIADFLAKLSDRQTEQLLTNIASTQNDWRSKSAQRAPQKRMQDMLERWLGDLTEDQKAWIEEWAETLQPWGDSSAYAQRHWRENLTAALALRDDQEAFQSTIADLLLEDETLYRPEDLERLQHNRQQGLTLIARVNNHLTSEQVAHRRTTVEGYIEDFRRLSGRD